MDNHGTHGHLGRLIDKYGSKKDKQFYTLVRPDEFVKDQRKYKALRIPKEYQRFSDVSPIYPPRAQAYNYLKRRGITDDIIKLFCCS